MRGQARYRSDAQFSLLSLILLITAGGVVMGFAVNGYWQQIVLVGAAAWILTAFGLTWGVFFYLTPEATKVLSVLGVIAFFAATLTPIILFQSRESARRTQCLDDLRKQFLQMPSSQGYHPEDASPQVYNDWAQLYAEHP